MLVFNALDPHMFSLSSYQAVFYAGHDVLLLAACWVKLNSNQFARLFLFQPKWIHYRHSIRLSGSEDAGNVGTGISVSV